MAKILAVDLETAPNILFNWHLRQRFHHHDAIIQEQSILCGAWADIREPDVVYTTQVDVRDPYNDEAVVRLLAEEWADADVLLYQNGDKFDWRFLQARMLKYRIPPMPPVMTVDTLKILKKEFFLNAYGQDYVSKFLGRQGKVDTKAEWWYNICNPWSPEKVRREYLEKMVYYNTEDVNELVQMYHDIRPYATRHPAFNLIAGVEDGCPTCTSTNLRTNPSWVHHSTTRSYQRYRCDDCGAWCRSTRMVEDGRVNRRSV